MARQIVNSPRYGIPLPGFSQAVKAEARGTFLYLSGVTSRLPSGELVGEGDIEAQARQVMVNIKAIIEDAGGTMDDVVRLVTYVRRMDDHPTVRRIRHEYFGDRPPASTLVEVSRLFDPRQLIEVEATAILQG